MGPGVRVSRRGAGGADTPAGRPSSLCVALILGVGFILSGCATAGQNVDTVSALRAELARRAPEASLSDRVVPFEIERSQIEAARGIVRLARSDAERAQLLLRAVQQEGPLGLTYSAVGTTVAAEALRRGVGNCMAIASVVVGLARALGLESSYILFAGRPRETQQLADLVIDAGHVGAVIRTEHGAVGFDIGPNRLASGNWRAIDDLEASSLFFNNRGFELLEESLTAGEPLPWEAARLQFWLATRVFPSSAEAANNLGVASARLGREEEALAHYRRAIALDPEAVAPRGNIANIYLRCGRGEDAVQELALALSLAPDRVDLAYRYGLALLQTGDQDQGLEILRQAAARDPSPTRGQELLRRIARRAGITWTPPQPPALDQPRPSPVDQAKNESGSSGAQGSRFER